MKQTLLFAFCGIMAAGAAFAPPSAEVLSKACDLEKNVLVTTDGANTCVPKYPCDKEDYKSYCTIKFDGLSEKQAKLIAKKRAQLNGNEVTNMEIINNAHLAVQTSSGGYVVYQYILSRYSDKSEEDLFQNALASACFVYKGYGYDRRWNRCDRGKVDLDCQAMADFASVLTGEIVEVDTSSKSSGCVFKKI